MRHRPQHVVTAEPLPDPVGRGEEELSWELAQFYDIGTVTVLLFNWNLDLLYADDALFVGNQATGQVVTAAQETIRDNPSGFYFISQCARSVCR